MADWAAGYVTEIDYTHGYFRELCPTLLRYVLLQRGMAPPPGSKPRYLELGFGQGLSLAIHAAACPGAYWGTDFNPAHAAAARQLAHAAGIDAHIFDLSFERLAAEDLPEFDIIALHGVWSWISAHNRAVIVDLVHRRLAPGGLLYVSYNCTPGCAAVIPLRELLKTHADLSGAGRPMPQRIDQAIDFAVGVAESGARFFKNHPLQTALLKAMRGQDRSYIAHEYFNRDWQPMGFADVATLLAEAKLEFAGPAHLLDMVDSFNLTADMKTALSAIANPVLREATRDLMMNQDFRRDVFVKGSRPLSAGEQVAQLLAQRVILMMPPGDVPMKVNVTLGEMTLQENIYRPLLTLLAGQGGGPKQIGALLADTSWKGNPLNTLLEALLILIGTGNVAPAQDEPAIAAARPACAALNRHLRDVGKHGVAASHLASPVTGGGVHVGRFQQMFLSAREAGMATPRQWAGYVWKLLSAQQQRLIKDGAPIETAEGNLTELINMAEEFADKGVPLLEAMGIA
jgi:SAM-dependent methyltransferase